MKNNESKTRISTAESLHQLCDLEFLVVTGKGGVGKSTASALLALYAAASGRSVLVVHPEGAQPHSGLWNRTLLAKPSRVAPGVDAVSISSERSMREYSSEILKSKTLVSALFHSKIARGFLAGMPGLTDWAILGKTWSFTRSGARALPFNNQSYDLVILDAPSSGDGAKMLRVPEVILELSTAGRLRSDAQSCLTMLRDSTKTNVILVSLAEELAVVETEENLQQLREELKLHLGPIIVNQVLNPAFSASDRDAIVQLAVPDDQDNSPSATLTRVCKHRVAREKLQENQLDRLNRSGLALLKLPRMGEELAGIQALKKLQMDLAGGD